MLSARQAEATSATIGQGTVSVAELANALFRRMPACSRAHDKWKGLLTECAIVRLASRAEQNLRPGHRRHRRQLPGLGRGRSAPFSAPRQLLRKEGKETTPTLGRMNGEEALLSFVPSFCAVPMARRIRGTNVHRVDKALRQPLTPFVS